jgi:flagellar assembly protein FliH
MANSAAVPFRFDLDFGGASPRQGSVADDAALEDAYARGEAAGREAAMASETAALHAALERLGARLAATEKAGAARTLARDQATVELALAIGGKLAGAALAHFPLADIERLAAEGFVEARGAPHVAVTVHDGLVDEVKSRLAAIAGDCGFGGKIVVLGDPEMQRGDARLEWADGGMAQSRAALNQALDDVIAHYLAAQPEEPV